MDQDKKFTYREVEAAIDMALVAGGMLATNRLAIQDSRELIEFISKAAVRFEHEFMLTKESTAPDDYMGDIEAFAVKEFQERYSTSETGE